MFVIVRFGWLDGWMYVDGEFGWCDAAGGGFDFCWVF